MSRFWNEKTKSLSPYVAGEQPGSGEKIIKLNTNENPYPPAPAVSEFLKSFDPAGLSLYPDPAATKLCQALADRHHLSLDQVFCGNGSDEVLALCFQAFFESGPQAAPILFPDISYSFYPVYGDLYSVPYRTIALNPDFTIPVKEFCQPSGGVVIANPNAPTGLALDRAHIEQILGADPNRLVLIDEAYVDFGGESCVTLLDKYPNLLVVGTFSKSSSLAGLRVGYAFASPEIIHGLQRVKDSFNSYPVDTLAIEIATLAVLDRKWHQETVDKIVKTRDGTSRELISLGFAVLPSATNFLFVKPPQISAALLYKKLREAGILVRYFQRPRVDEFLRISIGTEEDMEQLITKIRLILQEG